MVQQNKEGIMKSSIFYNDHYQQIEINLKTFLNSQDRGDLGLSTTVREAGDRIKAVLSENLAQLLGTHVKQFEIPQSARAMANFQFTDQDNLNYFVDVVTHNEEKKFSMPNITSVDRLEKLYQNDKNIFVVLLIDYKPSKTSNFISNVSFLPVEFFAWDCLTIGALGIGQLQIKRASRVIKVIKNSRKNWMREFSEHLMIFYAKETSKTAKRLTNAADLLAVWKSKTDIWI